MEHAIKHLETNYSYSKDAAPEENYLICIEALRIARNEALGDIITTIGEMDKYWYGVVDEQHRAIDLYDLLDKIKEKIK